MQYPIYVTGMGIISSIGCSTEETLHALSNQNTGMGRISLFETKHKDIPVCEVKRNNEELLDMLGINTGRQFYSRTALLGIVAAREAMHSAKTIAGEKISLVTATTVGGMDFNEQHYHELLQGKLDKRYVEILDCADATQKIADDLGISENIATVSTACSSSANAIIVGARMIRNGIADKVLAGGSDALTRFTLNGFNSLEIVSPTGCKPFDANRNGVTLGEGAAYLVLESGKTADPANILCQLSGYANSNEAYHQTASSPDGEGAILSIRKALELAGLTSVDIDYVNAHGTGTIVNDLSEGRAIEAVFGKIIPPVSSTKGFTGHTLAAVGAVEAVISILSLKHQMLFPNLYFETQMPELSFQPQVAFHQGNLIHHVLSNSFGFGGSNASLIFSKR